MWLFLKWRRQPLGLPREVWGSILLLALAQQRLPVHLVRLGPDAYRQRPRLDPQRDDADLGRARCPSLTQDERMTPRKIAGVLLGFGGVATMIGPSLLANVGTDALAQLACIAAPSAMPWPASGRGIQAHGPVADVGDPVS